MSTPASHVTGPHPGTASLLPCEHGSCWKGLRSGCRPCVPRRRSSERTNRVAPSSSWPTSMFVACTHCECWNWMWGGAGGHRCFAVYLRSPQWQQWTDSREGPHISRYQNLFGVRLRCETGVSGKHQREAGVWTAGAERHSGKRGTGAAWTPGRGRPS